MQLSVMRSYLERIPDLKMTSKINNVRKCDMLTVIDQPDDKPQKS